MNLPDQRPFVLLPGEGRSIDLGGFQMTLKASEADTGDAFSLLEAEEPADFGPPLHIHENAAEAFYVLQGEYIMFIEDQKFSCPTGSFIYIPQGVVHTFRVGSTVSRKLNLYTPAAMVGYFDELSAAISMGQIDSEGLNRIALRYGMHVLGPVPEGYL
jgi:mannose-6-phosphate isomerase-like protein (cupin superfamily)